MYFDSNHRARDAQRGTSRHTPSNEQKYFSMALKGAIRLLPPTIVHPAGRVGRAKRNPPGIAYRVCDTRCHQGPQLPQK